MLVQITEIIGTRFRVYSAWEPTTLFGDHSVVRHIDNRCYGKIGSEITLPQSITELATRSPERVVAVRQWQSEKYQRAYDVILSVHPNASNGKHSMGEIIVYES